jgi:hypothetical protein
MHNFKPSAEIVYNDKYGFLDGTSPDLLSVTDALAAMRL